MTEWTEKIIPMFQDWLESNPLHDYSGVLGTWRQVNEDGFGQGASLQGIFSICECKGVLYALVLKADYSGFVIYQYSNSVWSKINLPGGDGFGNANNSFGIITSIDDILYICATNYSEGVSVWTYDGSNFVNITPVSGGFLANAIVSPVKYKGNIYFGTMPIAVVNGQLWKYDGVNFTQVDLSTSIDLHPNYNIGPIFQVFGDYLYMMVGDVTGGDSVWRYDGINFVEVITSSFMPVAITDMCILNGKLYLAAGQYGSGMAWVIEYDPNTNIARQVNVTGFGESNDNTNDIVAIDGYIFAFPGNTILRVWTWNEQVWSKVKQWPAIVPSADGQMMLAIHGALLYNNKIYFGTYDWSGLSGCEVWEYDPDYNFNYQEKSNPMTFWSERIL